jgi:hypothetical protein
MTLPTSPESFKTPRATHGAGRGPGTVGSSDAGGAITVGQGGSSGSSGGSGFGSGGGDASLALAILAARRP